MRMNPAGHLDHTVAAAVDSIQRGAVVHFATHARTTANDPLMNHLLLAGDEPLFADDVARRTARGRLAVLSACDTANPGDAHADESLGLTGAFLTAGFPAVASSLWSVADRHTAGLMRTFADRLRNGDKTAAASSRAAAAPAGVWAAFVLTGT
jgi:CHAT domain-containing protein